MLQYLLLRNNVEKDGRARHATARNIVGS